MKAILWHGSTSIIERPVWEESSAHNDFGPGFYCTAHEELAKEWSCPNATTNGYANRYEVNFKDMKVLDLTDKNHNILNWLALVLSNRKFLPVSSAERENYKYLLENFLVDMHGVDIMIGYRGDDSYYYFAKSFISDRITLQQFKVAMDLGKPRKQVVLKSEGAFEATRCTDCVPTSCTEYYIKRKSRDENNRAEFMKMLRSSSVEMLKNENALKMSDVVREEIKNGDPRL